MAIEAVVLATGPTRPAQPPSMSDARDRAATVAARPAALAWRALNQRDRTVDEVGGMLLGKRVEPASPTRW